LTAQSVTSTWRRRLALCVPVLVLVSLFVVTGFRGVDLGDHWDEVPWHIQPACEMVTGGVFLPHAYIYPSLSKWFVLLPALPQALWTAAKAHGDPAPMQAAMQAAVCAPEYLLTARRVFIVVTALSIIWIYGAVLALRRTVWEAIVAASCLGLSWEFAYHSRWVTNDCLLTQFAALLLLALALFRRLRQERWLYLAAVAVGFGVGAKQPGVFLLVPVLLTSVLSLPIKQPFRQMLRLAGLCAVAFAVFVVTTPGVLLEPFVFLSDARSISTIYGDGHGGFTTNDGWQHLRWVLTYLSVEFFSPFHAVSIALSMCAMLGAVVWLRKDWRFATPLLAFPVLFLYFFCSRYVVVIARNYLQITPFFSLLAARGVAEIFERLNNRWVRWAGISALGAVALAQAVFLIRAAESIRHIDPAAYVREAIAYVAAHPAEQFRVSNKVRVLARTQHLPMPANVTEAPGGQAVVMFGRADMGPPGLYKENDPWLTDAVFGPREVNFNWYAVWGGNDRVVVMPIEKARAGAVPLAK
jgi:hypothetical protein